MNELWVYFGSCIAMVVILYAWAKLDDWIFWQKVKAREEAFRREQKKRETVAEARPEMEEGTQGDLFTWGREGAKSPKAE